MGVEMVLKFLSPGNFRKDGNSSTASSFRSLNFVTRFFDCVPSFHKQWALLGGLLRGHSIYIGNSVGSASCPTLL